jgi:hypothetical protein
LDGLTFSETQPIGIASSHMSLIHLNNGTLGSKGHYVAVEQKIGKHFLVLPRHPYDVDSLYIIRCGRFSDQEVYEKVFKVRRKKVLAALYWLVEHNVLYHQTIKMVIGPSSLDWMGDDDERLFPINFTIDKNNDDTPEDDDLGPSPDQNLMEHLDKIEDLDSEVSGTLDNTDCKIPTTEGAEILKAIRNNRDGNDKGTTIN